MADETNNSLSLDVWAPKQIAVRVESLGVTKARADLLAVFVLAILAGAFISLGAIFFTVVTTGSPAGFGMTRLIGGLVFCLGLILVIVAGAELFTGNNLIAMAWVSRKVTTREMVRNWVIVYAGNVVGAVATVMLVWFAGIDQLGDGAVRETALAIGRSKAGLTPVEALFRGLLCNTLVCLAVWLAMGGRSLTDKLLAVLFPITAFVALGLEHSIANWFFLPYAIALDGLQASGMWAGAATNLALVTVGNLIGGSLLVAGVYWIVYLRGSRAG